MLRSLLNVMRKEATQTLRDRRMVFLLVAAPLIQLTMFGYAVNLDVDHIPTVVCDQDRTEESERLLQDFFANGTFARRRDVFAPRAAQDALESGEAAVAVIVPHGYARGIGRRDAPQIQLLLDGTDSTRAQVAQADASQFLLLHGAAGAARPGANRAPPFLLSPRIFYNPRLASPVFMVPGILSMLLMNVTAMLTAMGLTREKESGTLEQVLVTPLQPSILLAGKSLPFVFVGLSNIAGVLLLGSLIFDVPLHGSLAVIAVGGILYVFSTLGFGILLGTLASSQQQAMLGAFAFILPGSLLSGYLSPIDAMPIWLRPLTLFNPMRHFLEIVRGCLLKGEGFTDLFPQMIALSILGSGVLGLSIARFHKRLA